MNKMEFLEKYIEYGCNRISEFSGDMQADYIVLIEEAKRGAEILDIVWNDTIVPSHVWDCINNYGLDD